MTDDFRRLAQLSSRYAPLREYTDEDFAKRGLDVRGGTDVAPAMETRRCPLPEHRDATAFYRYAPADPTRNLDVALAKGVLLGCDYAVEIGSPKVWAWIPDGHEYQPFLDRMALEGGCERIEADGASVASDTTFYVGTVRQVRDWANGVVGRG